MGSLVVGGEVKGKGLSSVYVSVTFERLKCQDRMAKVL